MSARRRTRRLVPVILGSGWSAGHWVISQTKQLTAPERVLAQRRQLGVGVSIDDFGAGFTSLTYLSALAVDELKLDRSVIIPMCQPDAAPEIELVRATIDLGHALRLRVVAEGIENSETLELRRMLGCDLAQGYFIGKPVPADKISFEPHQPPRRRLPAPDAGPFLPPLESIASA